MKLEHIFNEAYFLMPKVYYLEGEGFSESKCKGYPGKLSQNNFETLYNGGTIDLLVTKWFKNRTEGQIFIKDSNSSLTQGPDGQGFEPWNARSIAPFQVGRL